MPEALRSLTTRGWALLAAGVTTMFTSMALDQPSLTRLGVLVAALPLLAAWWVGRSRDRLTLTRTVSPQLVTTGQAATVDLVLRNHGRPTSGTILLEEQVPHVLGSRPRFVLAGIDREASRRASYPVRSDLRGQFDVGPMTLRVSDPFGLVELGRKFDATNRLTVTPSATPLPSIPLGGAWTGSGDDRPRAFSTGSAHDVTVRAYRRGDDLRRVHWRSSARTGELMVRREEQPWQSRATVFLDNRTTAHRGRGAASSLEAAVSAAASIAVHLSRLGYTVRLVTAAGESRETQWHSHSAETSAAPLLEALAVLRPTSAPMPDSRWLAEAGVGGVTIGIFGLLADSDAVFLRRLRHQAASSLALALDVDAWDTRRSPTPDGREAASARLRHAGWRSVPLGPGDRLPLRWQELGAAQGQPTSHAAGAP